MRDHIRQSSPPEINKTIDRDTLDILEQYKDASPDEIHARLQELDASRDLESYVEMVGGGLAIAGALLASRDRRMWLVPAVAGALVVAHALPMRDPLTSLLRYFGIWSRQEIEREKHALKALRGDYRRVQRDHTPKGALATAQGNVGLH
jgi:hypothetical protein